MAATKTVIANPGMQKSVSCIKFSQGTTSKWLDGQSERTVFCNVIETGDICEMQIHDQISSLWAIALRPEKPDKKGNRPVEMVWLDTLDHQWDTTTNTTGQNHQSIIRRESLDVFWPINKKARIRINNDSDKKMEAHSEEDIRNQITCAIRDKTRKWHNSQHFAYWCRHGKKAKLPRLRHISDITRWGTIGASAGIWMFNRNSKRTNSR